MTGKTGNIILIAMIIGAILGVIGGYFFDGFFLSVNFIGTMFLNALKMVVVPLIVASMIVGVTTLGDDCRGSAVETFQPGDLSTRLRKWPGFFLRAGVRLVSRGCHDTCRGRLHPIECP